MSLKYTAIRTAFEGLALTHVPKLVRLVSRSRGVIFTLHRVLPDKPAAFSPNAILQVTPDFLDEVITGVRKLGIDIVSLDEAIDRLRDNPSGRRFAVFTFDDGYRDNLVHALPILKRRNCPFTLYVPTALVDGDGEVWWQALEDIIASRDAIGVRGPSGTEYFGTATLAKKQETYNSLYWRMRKMPEAERVALMGDLAEDYGLDLAAHCRSLIMDWSELQTFADEKLCTIGAHTVHHYELAKLTEADARDEIAQSVDIIAGHFGKRPQHLSYPIGGKASADFREFTIAKELGLKSAVTTRPGGLYADHMQKLHELPRISLNGLFQERRYVDVFATGAVFSTLGKLTG